MHKQILSTALCAGKAVERMTVDYDHVTLLFKDGDYILVRFREYTDGDDDSGNRICSPSTYTELMEAGLISREEFDRKQAASERAAQEFNKRVERATYERLRAIYGPAEDRPESRRPTLDGAAPPI